MSGPIEITPAYLRSRPLPTDGADSDKDAHGQIMVVGAGVRVAGATLLVATAAMRSGAGKLQIAAPNAYAVGLSLLMPEALVAGVEASEGELGPEAGDAVAKLAAGANAVVIGPGLIDEVRAGALAVHLLHSAPQASFLIDAAALTGVRERADLPDLFEGRAVLTPHSGEMAKFMGLSKQAVQDRPSDVALACARRTGAVVALKGAQTHIASPTGELWRNSGGVAGLGVSGSGDVLAGVIGGLLARGAAPAAAAIWGVYLHAQAGRRLSITVGPRGFLARELLDAIPAELLAADAA